MINILLTLTNKVNAMEKWTLVQEKKRRSKRVDSDNEASDGEETDDTVAEPTPREQRSQGKHRGTDTGKSRTQEKEEQPKPEPRRKKDKKYYAVARGVTPGVYTTWMEARVHVDGFRNAMHHSFECKAQARKYVENNHDPQAGDDSNLAGATLDTVQLPGRFNTTAEDGPSSMAEAIAELAEDKHGEWAGDGFRCDVQWKVSNRTSLKTITSRETLQERHTELQGLKGDVYENQVNA
jgi:hypothetical protein